MKTLPLVLRTAAFAAAISCAPQLVWASTLVYDSGVGAGIQAGNGTWDFNTTSNWTADGGASRINWTGNSDLASFQLQGTTGTVTIGATQVGTGGLTFSGTTGSASNVWTLGASGETNSIQLGSGGLANQISDGLLVVNAPLVLTASQTWTSNRLSTNSVTAGVRANGPISTLSGNTNLTFDGLGLSSATKTASGDNRVIFELGGNNTFSGTTTVTGGAVLRLSYITNTGSKLDASKALSLKGGSLVLNGGSGLTETVASTTVDSGANTIYRGPNGGTNVIALGALTTSNGGTLDISAASLAATTTTNTNGIIGGWATLGGTRFAVGSADGSSTNMTNTSGSTLSTYSTALATTNYLISGAISGSGDKTINSLRMASGGSLTLSSGTLTIASGGIIGDSGGPISGGNLTSGTTALYVHAPSALTISSAIIDGASSVALVKAGGNTLTINGANTYTGATYVNSGTLAMTGGSLANGNVFVRGAAAFTMNASSAITFNLTGTTPGQFDVFTQDVGGSFTLGGAMNLKFNSTFTSGASFDLFNLVSGTADGFTTISVSGSYVGSLTESTSGIWTGTVGGQDFTFTEASGLLQVASAIPEPGTYAFFAGVLSVGFAAVLRRRRTV
ncbi:MAG: beta strand repeat-containing protein [Rariglobus sp.]